MCTLLGGEKLKLLLEYAAESNVVFGAYAELGVYKGGAAKALRDLMNPLKELHLFDTFSGMPSKGPGDVHEVGDFSDTSLTQVRTLFLPGDKVLFHVGDFEKIALPDVQYAFAHLDADQYSVTLRGLEYFYPRLTRGGHIVLDDYEWPQCPGIKRAVEEFFKDKPEKPLIRGHQAIIKKL